MFSVLFFALFWAGCYAMPLSQFYSYSPAVGAGTGEPFATSGEERITGIRVWERTNSYIMGFQVKYGFTWGKVIGQDSGNEQELELFDDEALIQVSGKYNPSNYIYRLVFVTNKGRSLMAGQPQQISFNFYPAHQGSELRLLSGRSNSAGITSIGAHWGTVYLNQDAGNNTMN